MINIDTLKAYSKQFLIFLGLSVVVILVTGVLVINNNVSGFHRFFGDINPLLVFFLVSVLGLFLFSFDLSRDWFKIYIKGNLKKLVCVSSFATIFAGPVILLDLLVGFPADLNILFPESLLFYPAIAYIVEIVFHVLPISLLLFFMTSIFKNTNFNKLVWLSIIFAALLEPAFQLLLGFSSPIPLWVVVYSNGIHIFLINLTQLYIFSRYDFMTMFSFRIVYYLMWHLVWGFLRLELLF